jgi:hypothetical protein
MEVWFDPYPSTVFALPMVSTLTQTHAVRKALAVRRCTDPSQNTMSVTRMQESALAMEDNVSCHISRVRIYMSM